MSKKETNRETAYHLRMATKCKKYMMNATPKMRTYYMNKAKSHLHAVKNIGLTNLGIDLKL